MSRVGDARAVPICFPTRRLNAFSACDTPHQATQHIVQRCPLLQAVRQGVCVALADSTADQMPCLQTGGGKHAPRSSPGLERTCDAANDKKKKKKKTTKIPRIILKVGHCRAWAISVAHIFFLNSSELTLSWALKKERKCKYISHLYLWSV